MRSTAIRRLWASVLLPAAVLVMVEAAPALEITGQVTGFTAGSFTIAELQTLAPTVGGPTTEILSGDTYTGISLWSLLGGNPTGTTSNITTVGGGNNPILRNYIVARGGGKTSLLSVGEIDPFFGGTGAPYLIAYQLNGATLAAPILVVPQDLTRTRYVTDLTQLLIGAVPIPPQGPRSVTSQFSLSGVQHPGIYTQQTLNGLPATTVDNVTFLAGTTPNGPNSFTGVGLWDLLTQAGLLSGLLNSYLLATGSDGFQVLFSLAELDPAFGAPPDLAAHGINGGGPGSLGSNGFVRTVIPGDLHGGRFVSNIASFQVGAVPEPTTLLLFVSGIAVLGVCVRTRKGR